LNNKAKAGAEGERRSPWRSLLPALWKLTLLMLLLACVHRYVRFVLTPSIPRGLYFLNPSARNLTSGDILAFCPPPWLAQNLVSQSLEPWGHCPGGSIPLAKRLLAISPNLCSTSSGIAVDGLLLPWPRIPASINLPRLAYCGPTAPDSLFLVGESTDSIDSRVFGTISTRSILGRLTPVLVVR
jgi:type IV secretory pathway protease TraF